MVLKLLITFTHFIVLPTRQETVNYTLKSEQVRSVHIHISVILDVIIHGM